MPLSRVVSALQSRFRVIAALSPVLLDPSVLKVVRGDEVRLRARHSLVPPPVIAVDAPCGCLSGASCFGIGLGLLCCQLLRCGGHRPGSQVRPAVVSLLCAGLTFAVHGMQRRGNSSWHTHW